jgi:sRNA-binding regulator protein Hfq
MTTELKGPSDNLFKKLIAGKTIVDIKVSSGDLFQGKIIWQDQMTLFLETQEQKRFMIMKNAIVFLDTTVG